MALLKTLEGLSVDQALFMAYKRVRTIFMIPETLGHCKICNFATSDGYKWRPVSPICIYA